MMCNLKNCKRLKCQIGFQLLKTWMVICMSIELGKALQGISKLQAKEV
jgi:hypothetical protein